MARKRIRNVEANDSNDTTERHECKMENCPHIGKGIDIGSIKKAWKKREELICQQCKKKNITNKKNVDKDLLICMKCGNVGCGNTRFNHGLEHYETPRSDCHAVIVQMDSWTVRCLQCKNDINLDVNFKASDAVKFLKRNFGVLKEKEEETEDNPIQVIEEKVHIKLPITGNELKKSTPSSPVKHHTLPILGLENIGNTCYMNAIIQALAQTPGFVSQLEFLSQNNWQFTLKGGDNLLSKEFGGYLPSLEGKLGETGQLTKAVLKLTKRIKDGKNLRKSGVSNENPGEVLKLMKKLSNTFYIGEQHDSHELLRLLLEGLRTEDLKRYLSGIWNSLGICSPGIEVSDKDREQFIAYKKQAMEKEFSVDKIFGGTLVSILKCVECGEITTTFENFMDISLPVESEKPKLFMSERYTNNDESRPSKHQLKKERKMARRGRKKNKGGRNISEVNPSAVEIQRVHSSSESGTESEADVEDNLESETTASSIALGDSNRSSDLDRSRESCGYNADESLLDTSASEKQEKTLDITNSEVILSPRPDAIPVIAGSSPEHSLVLPSSEPSATIYSYSPEPSITEDFGSCEGGRGSPASSIEQADWEEESNCKSDMTVLAKSIEKDLQLSDESCPPPVAFELTEEDNVKEDSWGDSVKEVSTDSVLDGISSRPEAGETSDTREKAIDELSSNGKNKKCEGDEHQELDINMSDSGSNKTYTADDSIHSSGSNKTYTVEEQLNSSGSNKTYTVEEQLSSSGSNKTYTIDDQLNSSDSNKTYSVEEPITKSVLVDFSNLNLDDSDWGATLTPQPEVEDVYSAYHCLNQFFSKETLTGGNKIGCLRCTKLKNGHEPKQSCDLVMANAHKQLLFLKLPRILTIHFKRFEVLRSRMSKITRKVSFPWILDVAPYTSSRSKITKDEAKYELYAVVEHSGHMTSGHYVAYVRVDPEEKPEKMSNLEGKDNNASEDLCESENNKNKMLSGAGDKTCFKWYLISDTHVREVTTNEVSNSEAYLLFYKQV